VEIDWGDFLRLSRGGKLREFGHGQLSCEVGMTGKCHCQSFSVRIWYGSPVWTDQV